MKVNSPYVDYIYLMYSLKDYASPKSKLTTMIKSGEVIRLRRGLFLAGGNTSYSIKTLANKIYGPSYISFEYALSYYNLIPERVETVTSATSAKNKNKRFDTPVGSFLYRNIPRTVYPYGIIRKEEGDNPFLIATKEKALCDTLSKISGISSIKTLTSLLFENLRLDKEELFKVNMEDMVFLAPLYRKKILNLFLEYLKTEASGA
jgi:predicted transcriptional regulator of viral defense system